MVDMGVSNDLHYPYNVLYRKFELFQIIQRRRICFCALDASTVSMSWSEVFAAIPQSSIDGQENGCSIKKRQGEMVILLLPYHSGDEIIEGVILAMFCGCRAAAGNRAFSFSNTDTL